MAKEIFISYSRKDTAVADRICAALDRAGITYFIDRQGIGGGMEFPEILAREIMGCSIMLFLASENSYQSRFTTNEITFAFNKQKRILPYIIDNSTLPLNLEFIFSSINWRTIRSHPIDTTLVTDILQLLGRPATFNKTTTRPTQDEIEEWNRLGDKYYNKNDFSEAVKWFRKAAEQGHATAQWNLGYMYYNGYGVPQDFSEAVKWFRKAAEQGDAAAQCYLGYMYRNGYGVPQDYSKAVKWYRKAVEQGDAAAQCYLGYMYRDGYGVRQDYSEAVKWYRKAAEQGDAAAQGNLGYMYQNGYGVPQDFSEAIKWYRKAAEQGHATAQYNLGTMYDNGYGVPQDYSEAVKWYRKAAEQGDSDAQHRSSYLISKYHVGK